MRLVFLYVKDRKGEYYAERFREEGYCLLIEEMVKDKIVDEALIIIEGNANKRDFKINRKIRGLILCDILELSALLKSDDVIFVRGGFKPWHNTLDELSKVGHWLLLYAANTGRSRWKFWDIIFDDLVGRDRVDPRGRVFLDFRKPVNERLFRPLKDLKKIYDVCIGASRIHDRKGQWKAIDALIAYKQTYNKNLRAILPGPWARGVKTNKIPDTIKNHDLDVFLSGPLKRDELNAVFNLSRSFVHLGSHGQGDRGPMEAMRAGTPVLIGYPQYHAPWLVKSPVASLVSKDPMNPIAVAEELASMVEVSDADDRNLCFQYQRTAAGIREVSLPRMKRIFDFIRDNSKINKAGILDVL